MEEDLIKKLALKFSELTGRPAYFYDSKNWLHKAHNGEIKKLFKKKPEEINFEITIDEVETYLENLKS